MNVKLAFCAFVKLKILEKKWQGVKFLSKWEKTEEMNKKERKTEFVEKNNFEQL